jgi:DNA-binding response OmpR family regulator
VAETIAANGARHVLIVDADVAFVRTLEADFHRRDFAVDVAIDADEAVAKLAAGRPDLVVLDLYLPNGAALALLRRWKREQPELVVILVSGNASLSYVVDALNEGARRFFPKPVTAAALLAELQARRETAPYSPLPLPPENHLLCLAGLDADGIDRFFAL